MKDYTLEKGFWNRLKMFVENVQVNDMMSEEEKGMILHNCELKLLSIAPVMQRSEQLFCLCKEDAIIDKDGQCKVCGLDEKKEAK